MTGIGRTARSDTSLEHRLPGKYSALNVVTIMYAAFQQFAPETDLGIDLAREYQAAQGMR